MDKFKIKCLKCGCTNISIKENGDYIRDYDDYECWETFGYYMICNNCNEVEDIGTDD